MSLSPQAQFKAAIHGQAQQDIGQERLRLVEVALDGVCGRGVDADDPYVIDINHPASLPGDYLRPEIKGVG